MLHYVILVYKYSFFIATESVLSPTYWKLQEYLCRMHGLTLSQISPGFYASAVKVFWKHCGKRRNCYHKEQFLLFPQCFLPVRRTFCHLHEIQNCYLQTVSVWKCLKFVVWESVNESANWNHYQGVKVRTSWLRIWGHWCTSKIETIWSWNKELLGGMNQKRQFYSSFNIFYFSI